jgi:hypothetical protein
VDKTQLLVLDALKEGTARPGEVRLYRRGKLPGLFPARTRQHAEAASQAVRDGLIEIVRTEANGKVVVEWARVTPKGIDYLLQHESPARALEELREALRLNEQGMPAWVAEMRQRLDELSRHVLGEVEVMRQRLDQLAQRVGSALEQIEHANTPAAPVPLAPWAADALRYLDERRQTLPDPRCPLSELFAALQARMIDLSLKDFHVGLQQLHERGLVTLRPHEGDTPAPEPEYALLDAAAVYHYATRSAS